MLNKFIATVLILGLACPLEARIRVVQHKVTDTTASGVTGPNTLAAATRDGNLIVVGSCNSNNRLVNSVTDNATGGSNLYYQAAFSSSTKIAGLIIGDIWYSPNSRPGATTVTINYSGSAGTDGRDNFTWEVEGFKNVVLDKTTYANSVTGNGTDTGPNIISTGIDGFIAALDCTDNIVSAAPAAGNEFTAGGDISAGSTNGGISLISQPGGHVPAWSDGSGAIFGASIAAFKEAPTQPAVPFGGF